MLYPHEFLYLLCNAKNRLELIQNFPRAEIETMKRAIVNFDLPTANNSYKNNHLFGLTEDWHDKQSPMHVLARSPLQAHAPDAPRARDRGPRDPR